MNQHEAVGRAVAYFEASDDGVLLHRLLAEIALRARKQVAQFMAKGSEESIPPPADIKAAREAASQDEALKTLRATNDFALLQVLSRAIGRRVEALEIVASADFTEGQRVDVPERVQFPPAGRRLSGTIEATGTSLAVRLDSGELWEGPPSLARRLPA